MSREKRASMRPDIPPDPQRSAASLRPAEEIAREMVGWTREDHRGDYHLIIADEQGEIAVDGWPTLAGAEGERADVISFLTRLITSIRAESQGRVTELTDERDWWQLSHESSVEELRRAHGHIVELMAAVAEAQVALCDALKSSHGVALDLADAMANDNRMDLASCLARAREALDRVGTSHELP